MDGRQMTDRQWRTIDNDQGTTTTTTTTNTAHRLLAYVGCFFSSLVFLFIRYYNIII
jgi:hypothetical protein